MAAPIDLTPTEGNGEYVTIEVVGPRGHPIPTATVRSPDERVAHRVNARTGRWRAAYLYPDDHPVPFRAGDELELEVRAPGYIPVNVVYTVGTHHNRVQVELSPFGGSVSGRGARIDTDWAQIARDLQWVADEEPAFTPAFVQALGTNDPVSAGTMALALATQGPTQAEAAFEWATEALRRGRVLEGPAFVQLTDRMLAVRALSATSRWQLEELEFMATGLGDPEAARQMAVSTAVTWYEYAGAAGTDPELARALCVSASLSASTCR